MAKSLENKYAWPVSFPFYVLQCIVLLWNTLNPIIQWVQSQMDVGTTISNIVVIKLCTQKKRQWLHILPEVIEVLSI